MVFPTRRAACWLAIALAVSCSVDERTPAVLPQCEGDTCPEPEGDGGVEPDPPGRQEPAGCGDDGEVCNDGQLCDAASGECVASCSGCRVAGVCHADGAVNPVNGCEVCDTALSVDAFTPVLSAVGCVGAYTLALDVASVAVTQGSSASVALTLVRGDEHVLPVEVSVLGLPPGVNVEALELSGTEDFATLTLSVSAQAGEGVRTPLTVRASDGVSVVSQPLELFVRGEPGSLDLSFGDNGTARAAPPGAPGFQGTRVAVDGADRIVVAATSRFVLDPLDVPARASLTRFSSGGAVDTAFASGGTYLETPGSGSLGQGPSTFLGNVALAPDGYVLAGPLGEGVVQEASFVTRLDDAGARAEDFAAPTLGGGLRLIDVAVENGSLFAVGQNLGNAALYRSDLSGANASSFTESNILAGMRAVFWSPADNDFILAGNCDPNACFARFNPDSAPPRLNPSPVTEVVSATASLLDGAADAQGRYFAIATGWNLVRFLPEVVRPPGSLSLTAVVDELASGGSSPQGLERVGERLYVAAALPAPAGETRIPTVIRYSTTWVRDATFAVGGLAELAGAVEVGSTVDVAAQSDGRVIVATVEAGELVVYRVWD